jgi:ribonuclease HI
MRLSDPAEEFEAVWAVVRRLEANIRRLEAAIASLQTDLDAMRSPSPDEASAASQAVQPSHDAEIDPPVPELAPPAIDVFASERTGPFRLVFDGGSLGNPGRGYGSFHVSGPGGDTLHERLSFDDRGHAVTNNQAEYLTLIRALERLHEELGDRARAATIEIRGDSQLVVNQLNGRWKVRNEELRPLFEAAQALLAGFGRTDLRWHDRANSVKVLGH